MIDREVFLAAAEAIRKDDFDAIDESTGRIDVTVDGAHRSVDVAEMLVWLTAEHDRLRAAAEEVLSWPTKDMAMLLSNPPQNAALFRAQSVLRKATAPKKEKP